MGARCAVCSSEHRAEIEDALIQNLTIRAIATKFGVPRQSVHNHKVDHMPGEMLKAWQAQRRLEEVMDMPERMHQEWAFLEVLLDRITDPQGTGYHSFNGVDKELLMQVLGLRFKYLSLMLRVVGAMPQEQVHEIDVTAAWRDILGHIDEQIGDDQATRLKFAALLADLPQHRYMEGEQDLNPYRGDE